MRLKRVVAAFLGLLFAARAAGAEHLVSPEDIQGALQKARESRAHDLATVGAFLARPEVAEAARALGVDGPDLRERAGRLSDGELREIAARAEALTVDPVAGGVGQVLLIVLGTLVVLFIVLLVVAIANCDYATCSGA